MKLSKILALSPSGFAVPAHAKDSALRATTFTVSDAYLSPQQEGLGARGISEDPINALSTGRTSQDS